MSTHRDDGSNDGARESSGARRSGAASAGVSVLAVLVLLGAGTALVVLESCAHTPSGAPTPDSSSSSGPTTPPTTKAPPTSPTNYSPPPTLASSD